MGQLGDLLRSAREEKGVSLAQAEAATMIRRYYLQALEDGEDGVLPGAVYTKGFLRNYAMYLGQDPSVVLSLYHREQSEETRPVVFAQPTITPKGTRQIITGGTFAGVLLIAVLSIFAVYAYRQVQSFRTVSQPSAAADVATPTPIPPTPTNAPQVSAAALTVKPPTPEPTITPIPNIAEVTARISQDAWVQVQVDGKPTFEGILKSGQSQTWKGNEVFLWAGNAGGVNITFNGKDMGPLGSAGQVVKKNYKLNQVTDAR